MSVRRYGRAKISWRESYWGTSKTNHATVVKVYSEAREEAAVPKKICPDSIGTFLLLVRRQDNTAKNSSYSKKKA